MYVTCIGALVNIIHYLWRSIKAIIKFNTVSLGSVALQRGDMATGGETNILVEQERAQTKSRSGRKYFACSQSVVTASKNSL